MTLKSMTAYASAKIQVPSGSWLVEIHSVNRKTFDFSSYLPKELLFLDTDLRKKLQKEIKRGQITLRITKEIALANVEAALPSSDILNALKKAWVQICKQTGFSPEEINLKFLLDQMHKLPAADFYIKDERFVQKLMKGIDDALKNLLDMKRMEGSFLEKDIRLRLKILEKCVKQIEKKRDVIPEEYRAKLKQRLKDLHVLSLEDEQRIQKEIILFAEKSDITEEIIRLKSHFKQCLKYLSKPGEESIGKSLEFIMQEMHRETNTISAKSSDVDISNLTLQMKGEIEKIREQIQNIE